ncbi:EamA family transporter [Mucilaginibacter sp. HMF5004]|uniref:EamA family transporter n=1 Tax=Mucilaginibacter rivuli TaxID=2857527 RepID=UPI001C607FB7|nr:EamA family transporter [Mucilaginibacter rivuli]MBW4889461.1 EamA family transporter [Mucilaginibacter rivuli]
MSTDQKHASSLMVIIAFAIVYIVWGSTYFSIRIALGGGFPPMVLGMLRFLLAGVLLLAWCIIKGEKAFVLKSILNAAVSGILLLFISIGIVMWVEQTLPSAMVAILVSAAPIWFVLLDVPKWGESFKNKWTILGLIIGFGGVILLFAEQVIHALTDKGIGSNLWEMLLLIGGSIAWTAGSIYSKYKGSGASGPVNSAWQMLVAGILFIPASFISGEVQHVNWAAITTNAWMGLGYLVLFGSIAAFSAYVWLLQVRPTAQVSTYAYVNPVVAVLLGIFFAHENITLMQIAGLGVILGSVLLINLAKYRTTKLKA